MIISYRDVRLLPPSLVFQVGQMVLSAGQIGLDPGHMTMVPPLEQASLALSHVQSVLKACHASLTSALCGVCYYTTEEGLWSARRATRMLVVRSTELICFCRMFW